MPRDGKAPAAKANHRSHEEKKRGHRLGGAPPLVVRIRGQEPVRQPLAAFDQFFWIFQLLPLESVTRVPNCQAHLSAFS